MKLYEKGNTYMKDEAMLVMIDRFEHHHTAILTLKRPGYRVIYFGRGGGGFRPPYEINVPIHIQTCHTCHNPIFLWRSR